MPTNIKKPVVHKRDTVGEFALRMYPLYYNEYASRGLSHDDASRAAVLTSTQAAWESNYGLSNIAKKQHNYGGYGYNGKTYTTFKTDDDFVKAHVDLAMKNGMYAAKDLSDYAKIAKAAGYYEDTLLNYTNKLNSMKTYAKKVANVANTYQPQPVEPVDQLPNIIDLLEASLPTFQSIKQPVWIVQ